MRIKELIYDPQWALPEGSKDQKLPKKSKILIFLVADMQLYKRLCPSVRPLVCWSVGPSVMIKLESVKTSISALPTRPQLVAVYPALFMFYLFCFKVDKLVHNTYIISME